MNTSDPIRNQAELERFKNFYITEEYNPRNQLLITMGLNTALRISDILALRWKDVYLSEKDCFFSHLELVEKKTGKRSRILLNESIIRDLWRYKRYCYRIVPDQFLLRGQNDESGLSRSQAWRVIRRAADRCGVSGIISPHSLRKTFGYTAWRNGVPPSMLMEIFNHSSYEITKRYLGIEQEDRDEVFRSICI